MAYALSMVDVSKCVNNRAAAALAGVTEGAIRAAITRGELQTVDTAGDPPSRLILTSSLQAWIAAGKRGERKRGRPTKEPASDGERAKKVTEIIEKSGRKYAKAFKRLAE